MSKLTRAGKAPMSTKKRVMLLILAAFIVIALAFIIYVIELGGSSKDADSKVMKSIQIEEGSSTSGIAQKLMDEGIIVSAKNFKIYTKFRQYDGQYQAGIYAFSPAMTTSEIAKIMSTGKTNNVTFTIPEGYTEYQTAAQLAKLGIVDKDDFVNTLENTGFAMEYTFLKNAQKNKHNLEGYLYPETYTVPAGSDSNFIISTMLDQYAKEFNSKAKAKASKLGYTQNQIMVIASIVEKEAVKDADRDKVASVIYNRLDEGMPLQMDSTIQYARSLNNQDLKEDLTYDDVEVDSKYNTYKNAGLPPGPICSPGKKSIEAALNPAKTDYLYFVNSSKLDGSMAFSKSYDKFLKDKDAYYNAKG